MCRFIQIEHVDAVNDLDEIMKNPFIDGYIFGAYDLSGSINELGNVFGENTIDLIKQAVTKLKANDKYVGLSTGDSSEKTLRYWHDMGIDMLSAVSDFDFLRQGMQNNRKTMEGIMKGK